MDEDLEKTTNPTDSSLNNPELLQISELNFVKVERRARNDIAERGRNLKDTWFE